MFIGNFIICCFHRGIFMAFVFIILIVKINSEHRKQKRAGDARPRYQCIGTARLTSVFIPRAVQFIERFHSTSFRSANWVA